MNSPLNIIIPAGINHRSWAFRMLPPSTRFDLMVDRSGDGCHVWRGGTTRGYGILNVNGRTMYAHRFAWEQKNGPIPKGMFVCHHCDNPRCVKLDHLFVGTNADNMRDCAEKGRMRYGTVEGESHPNSKLTESDVREIRESKQGATVLSKKFGVSMNCIWQIRTRKTWKHVA